jgi:ABC-type dipeptide/oligopeptide/nickel transport system permease component
MKLLGYILKRLAIGIPTLFGLLLIVFFLSRVIPANPIMVLVGASATPEQIKEMEKRYGFDQPVYIQFLSYLKKFSHGDLGYSLRSTRPVMDELKRRLPPTVELILASLAISICLGMPIGIISALRRNSWLDHVLRTFTISGVAIPSFWLAIMLQLVLGLDLNLLPLGGQMSGTVPPRLTGFMVIDSLLALDGKSFLDALYHLILPAFTLSMPGIATIARFTRSGFLGVMQTDYIGYSRSMGLPRYLIVCKYALRNAIVATVTQIGLIMGHLLAGTVVIEYIYFWPGIGAYMIDVILHFDYDGILGSTLLIGVAFMIINIAVDVVQAGIDPKVIDHL